MELDSDGKYICPHNRECRCTTADCPECGWEPEVAKRRVAEIRKKLGMGSKLYKIPFTGYCEVWADSAEQAAEIADHDTMFFADYDFGKPICIRGDEEK